MLYILFFKQKTAYEMRISDWSSDVCSSDLRRVIMLSMCLSGALAGFVGINEVMGVHHRLLLNFTAGYGFTGIAMALKGRNHAVSIVFASLRVGIHYQGGADFALEAPTVTREMEVTTQGRVTL